jgi:hypothetical protein
MLFGSPRIPKPREQGKKQGEFSQRRYLNRGDRINTGESDDYLKKIRE